MKPSTRRLLGRSTLGLILLLAAVVSSVLIWRATHRPSYESSSAENSAAPSAAESAVRGFEIRLQSPDAAIISSNLAALPKDLMAIPFVRDVVTEDLVNYYEDNADRLGLKGSLKRIAFEHELTWSDQLLETILSQPAEAALWRAQGGKLEHFALVIERHPLTALMEGVAKVALSDSQLQNAGSLPFKRDQVPLYALRYMPRKTLFFAVYNDKLLVLSDATLVLNNQNQVDDEKAGYFVDWLRDGSLPRSAFHLAADDQPVQQILMKANYLSFGYQRFFPSMQALSLSYDGTVWHSALATGETWQPDGAVWTGMPSQASACAMIPFEPKPLKRMVSRLLGSNENAELVLEAVQTPLAICWFNQSRLYTPLIVGQIKSGSRAKLEPVLAAHFAKLIGMQELNLMTDDGSVQDARFGVSQLDWAPGVSVWQRPVGSEYGLLKAKHFDQPDSLANSRYFNPTLMLSEQFIAFSPDAGLVEQALKTWTKRYPAQADSVADPARVLLTLAPQQLAALLQKETFSSLPKRYESVFRSAAEQHLLPKLQVMTQQQAWTVEVDKEIQSGGGWVWRSLQWNVRAQ